MPDTPKMSNGLVQHITVEESASLQWVKVQSGWKGNDQEPTQSISMSYSKHKLEKDTTCVARRTA